MDGVSRSGKVEWNDDAISTVKSAITSLWPTILDRKRRGHEEHLTDDEWNTLKTPTIDDGANVLDKKLKQVTKADGPSIDWSSNAFVDWDEADMTVNFYIKRGDLSISNGSRAVQFDEADPK